MADKTEQNAERMTAVGFKRALCGSCAGAALLASSPVIAQSTVAEESTSIEDIVVTAQRRSERLENVPMAITAITPSALEKANIVNIQDISRVAPGVQLNFAGGYLQPAIRGVSALTNGIGNENNVAIYVDGFFVSDTVSINADMVNLAGIQVLKGPQGTLYGRQATGGAILINTLDPTEMLTGKFQASYGRFDERKIAGYVSGPLSDGIRLIVAGSLRDSDGYVKLSDPADNTRSIGNAAPVKQQSLRAKLQADVTSNLKATLAYNYGFSSDPIGNLFGPTGHIAPTVPGGNARAVGFYRRSYNYDTIVSAKTNEVTLKLELDTGIGTLSSYTGYQHRRFRVAFDFDGTYADTTYNDQMNIQKTKQQALDFVVDAIDNVDLVIGGLYFHDEYKPASTGSMSFGPGKTLIGRTFRPMKTEAYAFYADATAKLSDAFSIGVGGRYSSDKKSVSQSGTNIPSVSASKTFNRFTPRVTARYEITPRTNIYASFSKGFRSGSYNNAVNPNAAIATLPIKPEDLTAYEIGFKTAQSTFRFEAAAFYYDYKNLNVSLTIPNPLGPQFGASTVIGNAPKAKVYGIDFQLMAQPVERLNVSVGGAYVHARYGRFPNAIGTGVNATNTLNVPNQVQDFTGKQLARAPTVSGNLLADYTMDVGGGELRLSGNVRYTASQVLNNVSLYGPLAPAPLQRQQRFRQPAYTLVGGEINWTDPSDHYSIGVFGNNLLNRKYKLTYSAGGANDYFSPAPPITYGVKAGYKF